MSALPGDCRAVSEIFRAREAENRRAVEGERAERRLVAALRGLDAPFASAWRASGERLREERAMGLHPPMFAVELDALTRGPGPAVGAAANGVHVAVTEGGERRVVMVSAEEYDRLLVDRRLLRWERGR